MRWLTRVVSVLVVGVAVLAVSSASASTPDCNPGGSHTPTSRLQRTIDRYLGQPGLVNAQTDWIGAHPGDPVPFYWIGSQFSAYRITRIDGCDRFDMVGWYRETGQQPVIDGVDDGAVFNGRGTPPRSVDVTFSGGTQEFGFYLVVRHPYGRRCHDEDDYFFTNMAWNDATNNGFATPQAFVFDISRWKGPNSWLVCFEFIPGGHLDGPHCGTEEYAFEITCPGRTTPALAQTFGGLKASYR